MADRFTVSDVSKITGLSPSVLRIWEMRYHYPNPARNANGYRHYSVHHVETLKRLKALTDRGVHIGDLIRDGVPTFPTEQVIPQRGTVIAFTTIPQPVTIRGQVIRRELEDAIRTRNLARIRMAQQLVPTIHPVDRSRAVLDVIALAGMKVTT